LSKYITIVWPKDTNLDSLSEGSIVTVGDVPNGRVISGGFMEDSPKASSDKHIHDLDAPGANTGPPIEP